MMLGGGSRDIDVKGVTGDVLKHVLDGARFTQTALVTEASDGCLVCPRKLANLALLSCSNLEVDAGSVMGSLSITRCNNIKITLRPGSVLRTITVDLSSNVELDLMTYTKPFRCDVEPELRLQDRSLWTVLLANTANVVLHTTPCDAPPPSEGKAYDAATGVDSSPARVSTPLPDYSGTAGSSAADAAAATAGSSSEAETKSPDVVDSGDGGDDIGGGGVESIDIPNHMVGRLIGRAGATIRTLQQNSGAHIQIEKNPCPSNPDMRTISISGAPASIARAKEEVHMLVYNEPLGGADASSADASSTDEEKKPARLVVFWDHTKAGMEMVETRDMWMAGR